MSTERLNRAAEAAGYALAGYDEADDTRQAKTATPDTAEARQPKLTPIKQRQTLATWLTGLLFPQAGATS